MNNSIKTILEEFDKEFGVGEGTAGCDGCSSNEETRAQHREFVPRTYSQAYEEGRESALEQIRNHSGAARSIVNNSELQRAQNEALPKDTVVKD